MPSEDQTKAVGQSQPQAAEVVCECPECGNQIEVPWSTAIDGRTGHTSDSVPKSGSTFEGEKCRNCGRQLGFEVADIRNVREIDTDTKQGGSTDA